MPLNNNAITAIKDSECRDFLNTVYSIRNRYRFSHRARWLYNDALLAIMEMHQDYLAQRNTRKIEHISIR